MITKNEVTSWFQTLESYKRIDVMCALLNICLPFELRFLGTCLEELGRRDSQELRGMELRVNNPQAVASDMHTCQHSEPTNRKVRRKMALYLALIRACNRTCVNEIFRSLESWGELDFSTMADRDTLQELLLVYTMAAHHPVFDFEQHMKCMQIFEKIKENKLVVDPTSPVLSPPNTQVNSAAVHTGPDICPIVQNQHTPTPSPSHSELMHQHAAAFQAASMHQTTTHPQLLSHNPIQMLPQASVPFNYQQPHLTKLLNAADGNNFQQTMGADSMPHMISSNLTIPDTNNAAPNSIINHPNSSAWTMRQYLPASAPTELQNLIEHSTQSSSPLMSQQSSPCSSRPTSPNRSSTCDGANLQTQTTSQVRSFSHRVGPTALKNVRRPSAETTPPPTLGQQQQSSMLSNELILPQNIKHITEIVMNNETSGNQLQNLIRNGFTRTGGNYTRIKSGNYIPPHQQQQSPVNQQHYPGAFTANTGLNFSMQNMSMADMTAASGHHNNMEVNAMLSVNSNKSTGSDSSSSIGSSGELSPPGTPTLMMNSNAATSAGVLRLNTGGGGIDNQTSATQQQPQKLLQPSQLSYNKQLGLSRLNGRPDKMMTVAAVAGNSSVVNTNAAIIYAQQQQQQQQQQSQSQVHQQTTTPQAMYADILLTPGGNAGNAPLTLQNSLTNSNGGGNNSNMVSTNNNNMIGANTVLISSPAGGGGAANNLGNVITSNSLLLQTHQQPYTTNYSYHAATGAVQHLTGSTARPPLMAHNPAMVPPPHGTFRVPGFQLQPNGELYYPTFHPAGGIAFLSGGTPTGAPALTLRTTNSAAAAASTQVATQPPTPQQIAPLPTQLQATPTAVLPSPYSTLTVGLSSKPMSCYNCGSQTHSGRECQEASMDDVTRSAVYKLDYSQAASGAGAGAIPPAAVTITQMSNASTEASSSTVQGMKSHDSSPLITSNIPAVATATSSVATALTTASASAK